MKKSNKNLFKASKDIPLHFHFIKKHLTNLIVIFLLNILNYMKDMEL